MALDKERTVKRSDKNDERLVLGFGYAATAEGRHLVGRYLDPLSNFIVKMREEHPTPRRRQKSLTPDLWDSLVGVPNDALAEAILSGAIDAIWRRRPDDKSAGVNGMLAIGW